MTSTKLSVSPEMQIVFLRNIKDCKKPVFNWCSYIVVDSLVWHHPLLENNTTNQTKKILFYLNRWATNL